MARPEPSWQRGESKLHRDFKHQLVCRIQGHIDRKEPLPIRWNCSACDRVHCDDLLLGSSSVHEEYDFGPCRPDIALLDATGKVVWAIEVVVSHAPTKSTVLRYQGASITLIRFDLHRDAHLSKVGEATLEPDFVDQCVNPRCPVCGRFMRNAVLWIVEGACWSCGCVMKVAALQGNPARGPRFAGPEYFTQQELDIAKDRGCSIKTQFSRTLQHAYAANSCNDCDAFVGEHYLFSEYVSEAVHGAWECEQIDVGHYCAHCE